MATVKRGTAQQARTDKIRTAVATTDSFQNFAAKTGVGAGNLTDTGTYGFNPISRLRLLLEWMYRGSWVCGVAVDCVADDMTRAGIDHHGIDADDIEDLEAAIREFQVWQSLNDVAKWARLYGGAVGYIFIDGQNPSTPLRPETVGPDQFQGIVAMDRWMIQPDLMNGVKRAGPDFGLPEFYTSTATSWQFPFPRKRIHYTRLIRMEGIKLPFWQATTENMWGISILERVFDRLTTFDSVTAGSAQLAYKAYLRTLKIKNLRALIATGGPAYNALLAQIELIRRFQMNEGVTLLDVEDEFETHQYTFAGLADLLNSMAEQIAGATQVPVARLFGQSPGGLNSPGDHELRTYYDNVTRIQERWFRRPLDVVIAIIARSKGIVLGDAYKYQFNSLWQQTETEKAATNASDSSAVTVAHAAGLIGNATALRELRASGRRTGRWQSITDEDIDDAEAADDAPDPSELLDENGEPAAPAAPKAASGKVSVPKPSLGVSLKTGG